MREAAEKIKDQDKHMCAAQAARMLDALRDLYADTDETDPATLVTYALCDLRHVADLELMISFAASDRSGYQLYLQELHGAG